MRFVDGNTAMVMGALFAGCRFFSAYPITPASTLLYAMLERLPAAGGKVIQGEDEISAIGYCLGASMAGQKVMTATSGPGISLYSENISFAIAGEIPIVIVDVMRQGPSTGAATRGADGDIQLLRWGSSGGLPVIVLAPRDVRDCFTLTVHAFNLAERFRCPVFLASNKEIGMTRETLDMDTVEKPEVLERTVHETGEFFPFRTTPVTDVPPFLPIGGPVSVRQTSSSHGVEGFITSDAEVIQQGVERLHRKIEANAKICTFHEIEKRDKAQILLITYGVTARAAHAAARTLLETHGTPVNLLVLKTLWPVPEGLLRTASRGMRRILVIEMNLGQYVQEIRRVLGTRRIEFYGKMSGELIRPEEIIREVSVGPPA